MKTQGTFREFILSAWLVAAIGTAPAFAATPIDSSSAPSGAILAAWTQIVGTNTNAPTNPAPLIVARIVVNGSGRDCMSFDLQGTVLLQQKNMKTAPRDNPDTDAFPVTLCQATLPGDWADAIVKQPGTNTTLNLWQPGDGSGPSSGPPILLKGPGEVGASNVGAIKMVTLGDTGCRADQDQPHCQLNAADWPFHKVARMAASEQPDFVVHVGDYRYYREGHTPDTWEYWYQDLFRAGQPLLLAAPWAFTRGNHEQCHNAWASYWYGKGWFYFFEPTTSNKTARCPDGKKEVLVDPWYFDVSVTSQGGKSPYRFVMIDTGPDLPQNPADATKFVKQMSENFRTALKYAAGTEGTWWATHRPPISIAYYGTNWHYADKTVRGALLSALHNTGNMCGGTFCKPAVVLAGHIHIYQSITFPNAANPSGAGWPRQVITGNGGVVDVGGLNKSPCTADTFPLPGAAKGEVTWDTSHGYIVWTRTADGTGNGKVGWAEKRISLKDAPTPPAGPGTCAPTN